MASALDEPAFVLHSRPTLVRFFLDGLPIMASRKRLQISVKVICFAGVILAAVIAARWNLQAQEVHPPHLVGHEEAELLLRIQDVIDDWDPRKLENPLVVTSRSEETVYVKDQDGKVVIKNGQPETVKTLVTRKQLKRSDLAEFIADVDAAEALGKAFFWEMQAGSDFEVTGTGQNTIARGTACASCHYRNGADARNRHTTRIPHVVWDQYTLHPKHNQLGLDTQQPYPVETLATQDFKVVDHRPAGKYSLIVGSQGVAPRIFGGFKDESSWKSEVSSDRTTKWIPEWKMFGKRRQITTRNSPSVINAGFSDRLFHDGRAESTFNGFSIFGDADPREVIHRVKLTPVRDANGRITNDPPRPEIVPVKIALTKAALASQAVGPIVNEVEMSYAGRQFPNVAYKLLDAKVLGFQDVKPTDSLLSRYPVGQGHLLGITYRELIQRAFRAEWWDDSDPLIAGQTPLTLLKECTADGDPIGPLMEGNFSLYWGLSIMLYEASLVSNQSPFDEMMRGRPEMVEAKWQAVRNLIGEPIFRDQKKAPVLPKHESGAAVFQHGFRVFMNHGCVDCHDGPFFSELYERQPEEERLPLEYLLERALLPNSRADALVVNLHLFREGLLTELAARVGSTIPELKPHAAKIAIELEELRHTSAGRRDRLETHIRSYLTKYPTREDLIQGCTDLIFDYEKSLVSRLGNRTYFTEDERVAMAEALGGPVFVELMPIPPKLVDFRRPLPIQGPLATQPYAFYDGGFYALGVSPPRYDRGNGDKKEFEMTPEEHALLTFVAESLSNPATPEDTQLAVDVFKAYQEDGDAAGAVEKIDGIAATNDIKKKAYGDSPGRLRVAMQKSVQEGRIVQVTSSPGSAYRLKAAWQTNRYKSEGYSPQKQVPRQNPGRTSSEGTNCEHDEQPPGVDTSWNRDDIPFGKVNDDGDDIPGPSRRSSYHFLSRARRMVFNEEHWGYRKPFLHDNELAFWGAFKTPSLRNVELTAPYMHNGRLMTLRDVIDFYDDKDRQVRPGQLENPDKHPAMNGIDFQGDNDQRALEFFLRCLTDDRVLYEQGPFDHPSITIVNGYEKGQDTQLHEVFFSIDEVGEEGHVGVPTSSFPSNQ